MEKKYNKKFEFYYDTLSNKEKFKRSSYVNAIFLLISIYNLITSRGPIGVVASILGIIIISLLLVNSYFNYNKNK